MRKPPQVCIHMYAVGFGISGVEGGDMKVLCFSGFVNEAGMGRKKGKHRRHQCLKVFRRKRPQSN